MDDDAVREGAMRLLSTLLDGGNLVLQNEIVSWLALTANAEGFLSAFNKMMGKFSDSLQMYSALRESILRRGSKTKEKGDKRTAVGWMRELGKFCDFCGLLCSMCHGNFVALQLLMRDQPTALNKFNLFSDISLMLEHLEKLLLLPPGDDFSFMCDVFVNILHTIHAMVRGPCTPNQLALLKGSFFGFVGHLLPLLQYGQGAAEKGRQQKASCFVEDICRLKTSLWELLIALVENVDTTLLAAALLSNVGAAKFIDQLRSSHDVWKVACQSSSMLGSMPV